MSREDIAKRIAEDLLNFDALDMNNFADNTDNALRFVEGIVLERLKGLYACIWRDFIAL